MTRGCLQFEKGYCSHIVLFTAEVLPNPFPWQSVSGLARVWQGPWTESTEWTLYSDKSGVLLNLAVEKYVP